MAGTDLASLARTAVGRAHIASVRCESDDGRQLATARVHADGRGCLLVLLRPASLLVPVVERHPLVVVVVPAPDPFRSLLLEGVAHRVPVASGAMFRVTPLCLRLHGRDDHRVRLEDYFAAEPDDAWSVIGAGVDHLPAATARHRRVSCAPTAGRGPRRSYPSP